VKVLFACLFTFIGLASYQGKDIVFRLIIFIYNILSLSGGGRPFYPSVPTSVPSSIHPSSSSRKKKMMEEDDDDDEWRQQQFIQMFM